MSILFLWEEEDCGGGSPSAFQLRSYCSRIVALLEEGGGSAGWGSNSHAVYSYCCPTGLPLDVGGRGMDVPLYICCICFGQGILMAQSEAVVQNHENKLLRTTSFLAIKRQ